MNSLMDHEKKVEAHEIDAFKERERLEEKNIFLKDGLARRAAMNTRFHTGSYGKLGKACIRVDSEAPPEKIDDLIIKDPVTSNVVNEFDWETFKKKMQKDTSSTTTRTPRVRQKSTTSVGRRNNIFFSTSPPLHDSSLDDNQEGDLEKRTRSMTIG